MTHFSGHIDFRVTDDPVGHPALDGFSCGAGRHERVVNELVEHIWTGSCPHATTVLIMEHISGRSTRTIGVCAWRPRHPADERYKEASMPQYIHALGVSETYRGQITADGAGLGHLLLGSACDQIAEDHADAPFVWAYVARGNRDSHYIFDRHRFATQRPDWTKRFTRAPRWVLPKRPAGDVLRIRELRSARDG
jgi:hypothetical protein